MDVDFVSRVGNIDDDDDDDRPCQSTASANKASENASDPPTALLFMGVDFLRTARVGNLVTISRQNLPRSRAWRKSGPGTNVEKGSLGSEQPKREKVSSRTTTARSAVRSVTSIYIEIFDPVSDAADCGDMLYVCVKA